MWDRVMKLIRQQQSVEQKMRWPSSLQIGRQRTIMRMFACENADTSGILYV